MKMPVKIKSISKVQNAGFNKMDVNSLVSTLQILKNQTKEMHGEAVKINQGAANILSSVQADLASAYGRAKDLVEMTKDLRA